MGYIGPMFEVLVFVYENYWRGNACPEPEQLGRKLSAQGFEDEEIRAALQWLDELSFATQGVPLERNADAASATGWPEVAMARSITISRRPPSSTPAASRKCTKPRHSAPR